ncbi:hypothetical protein Csa_022831 [Cucumis sativus]|nr:hypothetical protein Csa_022831 [Cucumis sativus]
MTCDGETVYRWSESRAAVQTTEEKGSAAAGLDGGCEWRTWRLLVHMAARASTKTEPAETAGQRRKVLRYRSGRWSQGDAYGGRKVTRTAASRTGRWLQRRPAGFDGTERKREDGDGRRRLLCERMGRLLGYRKEKKRKMREGLCAALAREEEGRKDIFFSFLFFLFKLSIKIYIYI